MIATAATVELFSILALQGIKIYVEFLESSKDMTEEEIRIKWAETQNRVSSAMDEFEAEMEKD